MSMKEQDVERSRQRRSRIVQTLNVPQRVRSLAAALHVEWRILVRRGWEGENSGSFEHPARKSSGTCFGIALAH